jgi:superfamily II DNA/RNA helicase
MGEPRALIIAPTRELAVQIAKDAVALTKHSGLNVMSFVGGMDFDKQLKALKPATATSWWPPRAACSTSSSVAKCTWTWSR